MRRPKHTVATSVADIVDAFRCGLSSDNGSEAAGDAFLAVSFANRRRFDIALDHSHKAAQCPVHGAAWRTLDERVADAAAAFSDRHH